MDIMVIKDSLSLGGIELLNWTSKLRSLLKGRVSGGDALSAEQLANRYRHDSGDGNASYR